MKKLSVKEIFEKRIQDTEITMIASSREPFSVFEEYDAKTHDKLHEVYLLLFQMFNNSYTDITAYIHLFSDHGQLTSDEKTSLLKQWTNSRDNCIKHLETRVNEMSDKYDIESIEFYSEY